MKKKGEKISASEKNMMTNALQKVVLEVELVRTEMIGSWCHRLFPEK